jgi:hypothetical protein
MSEGAAMPQRGTVIRVPDTMSPGMIAADGREWPFAIEGVWRSPAAPVPNQAVELTIGERGEVTSARAIGAQQLLAEKLRQTSDAAAAWAAGPGKEKLLQTTGEAMQWAQGPGREKARRGVARWLAWERARPEVRSDGSHFVYGDKMVEFHVLHAEVAGSEKRSETHVSGYGGGGSVNTFGGNVSGYTAPVNISSSVDRTHEIWLRKPDGTERSIILRHHAIGVRPSHAVSVISFSKPEWNIVHDAVLVNHTAGKHWQLTPAEAINKQLGLERYTGVSLLVATGIYALFALPGFLFGSHAFAVVPTGALAKTGALLAAGYVAYRFIRRHLRISDVNAKLAQHMQHLVQQTSARK